MPTLSSDIESINHEIEKTDEALASLYMELGKIGCQYHKAIDCTESNAVFDSLCRAMEEYEGVSEHIEGVQNAIRQMNTGDREISKTNLSIRETDNRIHTLISSLGAVAVEIEASGKLPAKLSDCMIQAHKFEKTINRLIEKRDAISMRTSGFRLNLAERRIEKCKDGINDIFYDIGKKLMNKADSLQSLDNERVSAILDEIEILSNNRKHYKSVIHSKRESMSNASDSLKKENSTLRDLNTRLESSRIKLDSLYTEYGRIIANSMNSWLDSQAPEDLQNVCRKIQIENKRLRNQKLNKDYLFAQKEININRSQIDQLNTQLTHLENQKLALDKQISDVQNKIELLEKSIVDLENKQSEITRSAGQ